MFAYLLLLLLQDTPQLSFNDRLIAAMGQLEEGDDDGIKAMEKLVKDLKAQTHGPEAKGEDLLTLGTALFHLDRDEEAIKIFDRLIAAGQGEGMAQFYKGLTLAYAGRVAEALPLLRQTSELKPSFSSAWMELGRVYSLTDKPSEALDCFRKALDLDADNVPALLAAGASCVALKRHLDALGFYEQALKRDPQEQTACYNAGQMAQILGQFEKALNFFAQLTAIAPESWQALAKQVQLNRALGRESAAMAARERLMQLRAKDDSSSLQAQEHYCCEQIRLPQYFVMAVELFEPGDPGLPFEFLIYDQERTTMQRIIKLSREPGNEANPGGGLALLVEYPDGLIERFPITTEIDTYAQQRSLVLSVLDGSLKAISP